MMKPGGMILIPGDRVAQLRCRKLRLLAGALVTHESSKTFSFSQGVSAKTFFPVWDAFLFVDKRNKNYC